MEVNHNKDQSKSPHTFFIEKNLDLCSFLMVSEAVRFIKAQKEADGTVYFYFQPEDIAKKLASDYWSDTALCPPRKLFSAQRSLKDLIFSGGNNG